MATMQQKTASTSNVVFIFADLIIEAVGVAIGPSMRYVKRGLIRLLRVGR